MVELDVMKRWILAEYNKHLTMRLWFAENVINIIPNLGIQEKKISLFFNSGDHFLFTPIHS